MTARYDPRKWDVEPRVWWLVGSLMVVEVVVISVVLRVLG